MYNPLGVMYRTFVFVVEFNQEYTQKLIDGIECTGRTSIMSFPLGEKFIDHIIKQKIRRNDLLVVFLGYNFFDDYNHALMNGIEILESVKKINPQVEVVMMANEDEKEYGAHVMKLGAFGFFPKDDSMVIRANNILLHLCGNRNLRAKKRLLLITFIVWLTLLCLLVGYFILF